MVRKTGSAVDREQPFALVVTPAAVKEPFAFHGPCTTGSPGINETEKTVDSEKGADERDSVVRGASQSWRTKVR